MRLLTESLTPFAIRLEVCAHPSAAISLLNRQKFEAVIADLESDEDAGLLMARMHLSAANRTAVSFAITSAPRQSLPSARPDATFVLQRPLSVDSIRATFRAAFGMLVRERRRYFRCPVEVNVFVRREDFEELPCAAANISEGGMAIRASMLPDFPDEARTTIRFTLPGQAGQFFAETRVCWRRENDRLGLEFLSMPRKSELQDWLARKLDESLPESVAQLFRGTAEPQGKV